MRQVRYSVAASLDGYIAGPSGDFDWIPMDPDIDFGAMFKDFDAMLVGRKTYEVTLTQGEAAIMPGIRPVVCSRTMRQEDNPGVRIRADAVAAVDELQAEPGKDIWLMGGGELFRVLLEAGKVDSVEVGIIPILLGRGLPMLPVTDTRATLELVDHRVYTSGIVMVRYDVKKSAR